MTDADFDDLEQQRFDERKAEIDSHYRRAETRMITAFVVLLMCSAFFQWLMAQLPDLSSEALEVVCRVLYQ